MPGSKSHKLIMLALEVVTLRPIKTFKYNSGRKRQEIMSDFERMKELVEQLDRAARAYYQESRELMSNKEYDALYDELAELEKKTGTVLAKSPTAHAGYEVLSVLPKENHPSPMLSLDKTKEVAQLQSFLGDQTGLLSWKLDGLTIVLTYEHGVLAKAVTRGNGITGEVVTQNARQFENIPAQISFKGHLVLRGEAVISYQDFEKINEENPDDDAKYKNPRNLCAGSVRQLNSQVTAGRHVQFIAFALVEATENGSEENKDAGELTAVDFHNSREDQFEWLAKQGFDVVPYRKVTATTLPEEVLWFSDHIETNELPSDGLVLLMDDIAYGESLGRTAKFPRNAMAFKWKDETAETTLREIHWSPSRTGLINPVAVFDPVELEGTTVTRASVHNVSIVESLQLGIGDTITVYKANMIIPQIAENKTQSGNLLIPSVCPVCGGPTKIKVNEDVKCLYCENPSCTAKQTKAFELFVSRNAMNMEGLSEATIEKFIDCGFIHSFADIFHLKDHEKEICQMEGFGDKSCANLLASVEKARKVNLSAFVYALGIPGIGVANAKVLARSFDQDIEKLKNATEEELTEIDGIGSVMAEAVCDYFKDQQKLNELKALLEEVELIKEENTEQPYLTGLTFVITGSVAHFANRTELKNYIEKRGGKAAGSVSAKTSYLINNDKESTTSKNKKAKELNVPILSEDDFLALCQKLEETKRE